MDTVPPELASALRASARLVAFTGAGISAESGVPTFRDAQTGIWARFDPRELATPEAFAADPRRVWAWYRWRRGLARAAMPNAGHLALARIERARAGFELVTQNVDGLHREAGSRRLTELHGSLLHDRCSRGCAGLLPAADSEAPPACRRCGALLRPAVVWFGEPLPGPALDHAQALADRAEVFLSIGTSTLVYPAAELPFRARRAGAMVVEVNPEPTPLSPEADVVLRGTAADILPRLAAVAEGA